MALTGLPNAEAALLIELIESSQSLEPTTPGLIGDTIAVMACEAFLAWTLDKRCFNPAGTAMMYEKRLTSGRPYSHS